MINWEKFIDSFGLIKGRNDDGGDSLQRFGTYFSVSKWLGYAKDWRGMGLHKGFASDLKKFQCNKPGNYKRHPSLAHWYGDCDRMSRDQATPLVVALGVFGRKKFLWQFLWAHIKRLGFMTNTRNNGATKENHGTLYKVGRDGKSIYWRYLWKLPDFTGPEFWNLYLRGFSAWYLYPIICIFDLETLIGSIKRRLETKDDDVLNHLIICEYSKRKYPTPISWLANKVNSNEDLFYKLVAYCSRVDLPFDQLWEPILMKGEK